MANALGNPNWAKGVGGNPKGRPANVFASQGDVAAALMDRYPPSEILAIAADPARLDKLGSWSAIVLIQIANMLKAGDDLDCAVERERLLDRTVGKAVSRTELTGKNGAALQVNVITGVNATDAEFIEVVEEQKQIEDYSLPEPELSDEDKREDRREATRKYSREYAAKLKAKGKPSFNDRLAAKGEQ